MSNASTDATSPPSSPVMHPQWTPATITVGRVLDDIMTRASKRRNRDTVPDRTGVPC